MANKAYIGVDDVAREIKNCYVGSPKQAENKLNNGALSSNADGWDMQATSIYTKSFVDGALRITAKTVASAGSMYSNYQALTEQISGSTSTTKRVIYICATVRGSTSNSTGFPRVYGQAYINGTTSTERITLTDNGVTGTALNDGEWHTLSQRFETYNAGTGDYYSFYRVAFGISATSPDAVTIGDVMDIKNYCVIDLTDTFGSGNEPTKEWCDANLSSCATAMEVSGGRIVARKIKKIYVGDENNIARLCWSSGKKLSEYTVGSTVYLNENGSPVPYLIVHQGLPSDMYDSSCDGIWLLRKDCHSEMKFDTDKNNNYANSDIHNYLNNDFLALFDTKVQNIIEQVKIPYRNGSTDASGASGVSTKIFLLGAYEVGSDRKTSMAIDGAKLDYFESGTSDSANAKRIAHLNGNVVDWWTRTSHLTNTQYVWDVSTSGTIAGDYAQNNDAIRPALILPKTTLVDDKFNIIV